MTEIILRKKIVKEALKIIGFPYKRGAYLKNIPRKSSGFDCSSLTQYLFKKINIEIPRSSLLQAAEGKKITSQKLSPGDLIFFEGTRGHYWYSIFNDRKIRIGHVALYIGNGEIIEASEDRGGKVRKEKLAEFIKKPAYKIKLVKRLIGWKEPIYKVPAYSQILNVKNKDWQKKSCGIISLKMVIDFWLKKRERKTNIDVLIKKYKKIAYIPSVGWSHKGLLKIAKQYGFFGKTYDLACYQNVDAFPVIKSKLKHTPVIVSVYENFKPKNKGHLIVVTGIRNKVVYYNEPNSKFKKNIKKRVGLKKFLVGWKKRFIVIYPQKFNFDD